MTLEEKNSIQHIVDYAADVISKEPMLSAYSKESVIKAVERLAGVDVYNGIFCYRTLKEADSLCPKLNEIKTRSTEAFRPFISNSTRTLCHSMGNPLGVAQDVIDSAAGIRGLLDLLLKVVNAISHRYAFAASCASLYAECAFPDFSPVFDESAFSPSYRKEVAHMARYFRLHSGSYLAIELAKQLGNFPESYRDNRFSSVIELYEAGCADYVFNFVIKDTGAGGKAEEKLVTLMLVELEEEGGRKALGVHVYGDEKILLWKRWGDGYDCLYETSGSGRGRARTTMQVTPFLNNVAII